MLSGCAQPGAQLKKHNKPQLLPAMKHPPHIPCSPFAFCHHPICAWLIGRAPHTLQAFGYVNGTVVGGHTTTEMSRYDSSIVAAQLVGRTAPVRDAAGKVIQGALRVNGAAVAPRCQ